MQSIHQFRIKDLEGQELELSSLKGKKVLIVNVASACGYTPQYGQLEELYQTFKDKLVVVGVPCNDFGAQEPGTASEIRQFCSLTYNVSFPLTEKVNIKTEPIHPIYGWLTQKTQNGQSDHEVSWNFCKFLLDEEGQLIAFFPSSTQPASEELTSLI